MKLPKNVYVCSECDYQSPRWLGQCPSCGAWNTMEEETYRVIAPVGKAEKQTKNAEKARKFYEFDKSECNRVKTGIGEFDRVLGGGLVIGTVVLLAGEPGIGKSTLLMQLCKQANEDFRILYVSGEESGSQLRLRARRLGVEESSVDVLSENDVEAVLSEYERLSPDVVIVDSIQTMTLSSVNSSAGSITQVRECANMFMERAKEDGTAVILVGHVNKEGSVAGPKVLEHMVDAVLHFEGDRSQCHRIIRAVKNRYGSTNEIGVFEMTDTGLAEVENPSAMLLLGRPIGVSGSSAVCLLEGTRPIIAEIQALVTKTIYPSPKRMADGIDYNRMCLILAVLEKRLGLRFSQCDVYLNVVGGIRVDEPAADSAIALALISSIKDIPVPEGLLVCGEIGLSGEIRAVSAPNDRAKEAERIGFTDIAFPKRSLSHKPIKLASAKTVPVAGVFDLLNLLPREK